MPYAPFNYRAANDPEHWRLRAEEARTVAETFTSAEAREQMLQIAECYERIAEAADNGRILPEKR